MSIKLAASNLTSLYMLSDIYLIVYSFLDLSVCRTLLSICLSLRILVRHKLRKVLNG